MAWPDEIADGLPTPRDDEPASLRQDILDELSDHLSCAVHRELHRGNDETKAKQHVLERFGNPARIAYRLWFDAMKEKIMSQRITLAAAIVVAVACLFVAGMAWQMSQQNREANLAIIDKLTALATQQEQHKSLDWNPVKIKLVTGDANGPPAADFKVSLSSNSGGFGGGSSASSALMPQIDEVSGADGVIDFGLVRYGAYQLVITSPWEEHASGSITVRPGKVLSETIVCPSKPEPADLAIEIDWPDDLKNAKLWAGVMISFESVPHNDSGIFWGEFGQSIMSPRYVLIGDSGANINCGSFALYSKNELTAQKDQQSQWKSGPALHAYARHAFMTGLQIMAPPQTSPDGKLDLPKHLLARYNFRPLGYSVTSPPFGGGHGGGADSFGVLPKEMESAHPNSPTKPTEIAEYPTFDPKANQLNHWKIQLPEELIERLRATLKKENKS